VLPAGKENSMSNSAAASLQFLGAAGGVTGSKYLFSYGDDQLLIDCGLFQGLKELRLRNWAPVPVDLGISTIRVISRGSFRKATRGPYSRRRGRAISCA